MDNVKLEPGSDLVNKLKPVDVVGKTIGNFFIKGRAGNGRVKAKCLLCGNDNYETQWYKIKSGHTTSCGCKQKLMNPEQYIGTKYNKMELLSIEDNKDNDGAVLGKFMCDCGNERVARLNQVQRGLLKSCGKCRQNNYTVSVDIAKDEKVRIYNIWRQMMSRCYKKGGMVTDKKHLSFLNGDKPHARYYDYGARGIRVDKEWHIFENFLIWYSSSIGAGESLDRVNNDLGYGPKNARSADNTLQNINQRVRVDSKSGYKGVFYTGASWAWRVSVDTKKFKKEGYRTLENALLERNTYIVKNKLKQRVQLNPNTGNVSIMFNPNSVQYHISIYNQNNQAFTSEYCSTNKKDKLLVAVYEQMIEARKLALIENI